MHPAPGKTAVVTGAAGFIGRHLCRRLVTDAWSVRAIDLEPVRELPASPQLQWYGLDIRDRSALQPVLEGADVVFHLASAHLQVNAPPGWYESVNVEAVGSLVTACSEASVKRLVHVSSVGVYGHVEHPPADEDAPKHPTNEYERTKLQGETVALQRAKERGVDLIVLRPGWVYGPGCPRTAKLLRTIRRGRFFYVGAGANQRHPIYVDDCVEALLAAERASADASGRPYLVVGPRAVTVRELVETAAVALGVGVPTLQLPRSVVGTAAQMVEVGCRLLRRQPPISRRSLAFFEHDNAFDGRAATRFLGFSASTGLAEGLKMTIDASQPREQGAVA